MSEIEYETLEILWIAVEKPKFILGVGRSKFVAQVIAADGGYTAGESPIFLGCDRHGKPPTTPYEGRNSWEESHGALDELIDTLTKDGWELVETQENWYKKQFRRRMGLVESQPETNDVITQLERLNTLHINGAISDDEFLSAKKKLLGM